MHVLYAHILLTLFSLLSLSSQFTYMYHTRILMPNVMTPRIVSKTKQSIELDPSADPKTERIVYLYVLMHIHTYVQQTPYTYTS